MASQVVSFFYFKLSYCYTYEARFITKHRQLVSTFY